MTKPARRSIAVLFVSALLLMGIAVPAGAQQQQDGLVNVAIGDITVEDVNIGVAAVIAATVCDVQVGPVAVLARTVDRSGDSQTVCTTQGQDVVLEQN